MTGSPCERLLAVSPWIRFASQFGTLLIKPGDDRLQDHEEDEFLNRLPTSSSNPSEASTRASTSRDLAQHGRCADRIGEADHPGPEMEDECDGRAAWLNALTKRTNLGDAFPCIESGIFLCCWVNCRRRRQSEWVLRIASVWTLVSRAVVGTQLDARGGSPNSCPFVTKCGTGAKDFFSNTGSRCGGLKS